MKVLIIEPDRNLCRAILAILEMAGHEAHCAHDSTAVTELVRAQHPAFVLCDTQLPSQSGYEVLFTLRQTYPPEKLPIVLMSVHLTSVDMVQGLALGASGFLIKPFTATELLRKLETTAP